MNNQVSVIERITTHYSPYSVTYSEDGEVLAYGEGSYDGDGSIVCLSPGSGLIASYEDNAVAFSGICFDASRNYIGASMWFSRHHYHPAKLFKLEGSVIIPVAVFRETKKEVKGVDGMINRGYATGVGFFRGKMIVRRSSSPAHTITEFALHRKVDTLVSTTHLNSARLAQFSKAIATGCFLQQVTPDPVLGQIVGIGESIAKGLVVKQFWISPPRIVFVKTPHVVSAIVASADCSRMVTGGADGSIAVWSVEESPDSIDFRLRKNIPRCSELRCRDYMWRPSHEGPSIAAVCFLNSQYDFVTAEASGHIRVWNDGELIGSWFISAGSPRTLAANPKGKMFAVGSKAVEANGFKGSLEVFDISNLL